LDIPPDDTLAAIVGGALMIRHTSAAPCRVCRGDEAMPRGQGKRCAGFSSDDGAWVHCERAEHAGGLRLDERTTPATYLHRIGVPCNCGQEHAPAMAAPNGRAPTLRQPVRRIVATYDYADASGRVVYRVARFEPKGFLPQHMADAGTWVNGFACDERVLYHLPDVLANPGRGVFVVEGEKDADRLAALGLIATTNPGGAVSWRKHAADYVEAFRGHPQAVVITDNDAAGRRWGAQVASSVHAVGCPVRVLELPGLPLGGDVSDWFDGGHTLDELRALAKAAPRWEAPAETAADTPHATAAAVRLADVQCEAVEWLWHGRVARGKLTLIDGDPGLGKSLLTLDVTRPVTTGGRWPDGQPCLIRGSVLLLGAEDGLADTVRPRLDAAGADVQHVYALPTVGDPGSERQPCIPDDLATIQTESLATGAVLLVIDPLMAFLAGDVHSHRDQDVRRALAALATMAERLGVAVVVIRHLNKSPGGPAIYRGGGSIGIAAAARIVLAVGADPEDETRRVLVPVKANLTAPPASLAYRLVAASGGTVRIEWLGASTVTAGQLLAVPADDEERNAGAEAARFLRELLADGPVDAQTVKQAAREEGIAEKTLWRAAKTLGVKTNDRAGFGRGYPSRWSLLGHETPTRPPQNGGPLGQKWPSSEGESAEQTSVQAAVTSVTSVTPPVTDPAIVRLRELAAMNAWRR
jgi:putative DNA primase/helicase